MSDKYIPRLKTLYNDEIVKNLEKELNIDNVNKLPKLEKVIISCGVGKKREDKHFTETVALTLEKIAGQAPTSRLAKKSIASKSVKVWAPQLAISLHYATTRCMNSLIALLALPYLMFVTSTAYLQIHSICKVTTQLVLKSKPSSQKLPSKMLQFCTASKLLLLSRMAPRKAAASY